MTEEIAFQDLSIHEVDGVIGIVNVEKALNLAIRAESLEEIKESWRKAIRDLPDVHLWVVGSIDSNPGLKARMARILRKSLDAAIALCEKFGEKGGKGVLAYFEALEERTKEDPLATFPYDVAWIESWVELHHPRIQGGLAKLREGDVEGAVDEFRGRTGLRKEPKGQIVLSGEPFDDLSIYEDAMTRLSRGLELFASKKYPSRDDENADALMDARDCIQKARTIIGDVRFESQKPEVVARDRRHEWPIEEEPAK